MHDPNLYEPLGNQSTCPCDPDLPVICLLADRTTIADTARHIPWDNQHNQTAIIGWRILSHKGIQEGAVSGYRFKHIAAAEIDDNEQHNKPSSDEGPIDLPPYPFTKPSMESIYRRSLSLLASNVSVMLCAAEHHNANALASALQSHLADIVAVSGVTATGDVALADRVLSQIQSVQSIASTLTIEGAA